MSASPVDTAQSRLSRRELEIAGMVAQGLTNREIATRLFISERTVDGHLEHVREKLAVNTRAQIAAWVVRQGEAPALVTHAAPVSQATHRWRGISVQGRWMVAALLIVVVAGGAVALLVHALSPTLSGPTITTLAGTESRGRSFPGGGYAGDGYLAIHAQLSRPSDVAVAPDGTIYIADYGNYAIRSVATNGTIATVAGHGPNPLTEGAVATSVSLDYPSNIAVDTSGSLFVLTSRAGNLEVWRLKSSDHTMTLVVSLGPSRGGAGLDWKEPLGGLVVAKDGTLYVADRAESRVWGWIPGGEPSLYAGTGEPGFNGDFGAAASAQLWWPVGLAMDQKEDLYIADSGNNRIRMVDHRTGIITTIAGNNAFYGDSLDGGLALQARLNIPYGVAVGSDGTIVIADTGNNRVREITRSGHILALAGTGRDGFMGDGRAASQAELSGPQAVAFESNGKLLVADTENHRVREVSRVSP